MEVKADPPHRANPRSRSLGTLALVVVLVTPGVLTWLMSRAQPALPTAMPSLVLDAAAVSEQQTRDAEQAAERPDSEAAQRHLEALQAWNRGELDPNDRPGTARARREALIAALNAAVQEHGDEVRGVLRASDLTRSLGALRGDGADRDAELGGLVGALERYGMVRDGRQVAPDAVVRTVFKARWNGNHGRPLTEDLSDIELRAYWGWLALEADSAPVSRRLEAVEAYTEAGGMYGEQARATLLLQAGRRPEAAEAFEASWAHEPRFRVRNHALAARAGQ